MADGCELLLNLLVIKENTGQDKTLYHFLLANIRR